MIKFEFESLEELQSVLEATPAFHKAFAKTDKKLTLAETFVWVYEKTGED
jgi:hypothetical protein